VERKGDEIASELGYVAIDRRDDGYATGEKSDIDGCEGGKRRK